MEGRGRIDSTNRSSFVANIAEETSDRLVIYSHTQAKLGSNCPKRGRSRAKLGPCSHRSDLVDCGPTLNNSP